MLDDVKEKIAKWRYNISYKGNRYSMDDIVDILNDIAESLDKAEVKIEELKKSLMIQYLREIIIWNVIMKK